MALVGMQASSGETLVNDSDQEFVRQQGIITDPSAWSPQSNTHLPTHQAVSTKTSKTPPVAGLLIVFVGGSITKTQRPLLFP